MINRCLLGGSCSTCCSLYRDFWRQTGILYVRITHIAFFKAMFTGMQRHCVVNDLVDFRPDARAVTNSCAIAPGYLTVTDSHIWFTNNDNATGKTTRNCNAFGGFADVLFKVGVNLDHDFWCVKQVGETLTNNVFDFGQLILFGPSRCQFADNAKGDMNGIFVDFGIGPLLLLIDLVKFDSNFRLNVADSLFKRCHDFLMGVLKAFAVPFSISLFMAFFFGLSHHLVSLLFCVDGGRWGGSFFFFLLLFLLAQFVMLIIAA